MARTALFLDRDGVINRRLVGTYVRSPQDFELLDDVLPIMQAARERGMLLILITNQQGVGKGLMTDADLDAVHRHMQSLLHDRLGYELDAIYVCTDLDAVASPRRKPAPGMLLEAMAEHDVDASASWFLGDSITDAMAGRAAGIPTILVGDHPVTAAEIVVPTLADVRL